MNRNLQNIKVALLGGGQLGKMLLQESYNLDLNIKVMDPVEDCSCHQLAPEFVKGDFRNFDDVLAFGRDADIITIEFEDVNVEALYELEKLGKKVFPQPRVLEIIKDKGAQKEFYTQNEIPTGPYYFAESKIDIKKKAKLFPLFQKVRKGGYDGYGVVALHNFDDIESKAFDAASIIEQAVDIEKELSVIVSRNENGDVSHFPVVEMVFNEANMVDYLISPAQITTEIENAAIEIAYKVINKLEMVGLLAVELFLTKKGEVWVNEIAPRPHNSGHHTIEANYTSQYAQHIRAILNLKPGNTNARGIGLMLNILGEKGFSGNTHYQGIEEALEIPGVYIHLYGKKHTKPFRKMGHATIVANSIEEAKKIAEILKSTLKVIA
jgi:5-(carboxyamino)imidazole ribonucleotide synthase